MPDPYFFTGIFMRTFVLFVLLAVGQVFASTYYVSPNGDDSNPGTGKKPFKTIRKATRVARRGDTCFVLPGTYRDSFKLNASGTKNEPIRFIASTSGRVILNGTDIHKGSWQLHSKNIYKTKAAKPVLQVFVDGQMMVEARWPNIKFPDDLWTEKWWSVAGQSSYYGCVKDPRLAESGIDFKGATAMLNVAHQFFTWTREVKDHKIGSDTLKYDKTLGGSIAEGLHFQDDRYYLFGKLNLLDSPGEWFYDKNTKMLYLYTPAGDSPGEHTVELKRRTFAITGDRRHHVQIKGFEFFATAFKLKNCDSCVIENCNLRYPSINHHVMEYLQPGYFDFAVISGSNNIVRKCSFAYGSTSAIHLYGTSNVIENCIVHDFCWDGSLTHVPVKVFNRGKKDRNNGSTARNNTVYNSGGPLVHLRGRQGTAEYNHIYNGLRARFGGSKDGSLLYTGGRDCGGTTFRYNWVHSSHGGSVKTNWGRGIGIRADDFARNITCNNNVVWDCGGCGILIKGDDNNIYNNTVLDIGREHRPVGNSIMMMTGPEQTKKRPGNKRRVILDNQNRNSRLFNNIAHTITGSWNLDHQLSKKKYTNNSDAKIPNLRDISAMDFRPEAGSDLVDSGMIVEGLSEKFSGKAPDIGAYENGIKWVAGADWYDSYLAEYKK